MKNIVKLLCIFVFGVVIGMSIILLKIPEEKQDIFEVVEVTESDSVTSSFSEEKLITLLKDLNIKHIPIVVAKMRLES